MTDVVSALGPGKKLDALSSFAPDYVTVRRAFNGLLTFPHLEAIQVKNTNKINLLSLIIDGNSRFSELANIDIDLARKVISYDATMSALVDALSTQLLVQTLQPVAQGYADHARAESEANLKFFADASYHASFIYFAEYIGSVDDRISSLDKALEQLDQQIATQSEALANKNVLSTLWEILKTLYKLASTAEDSDVQIATILGVTISTIYGSFKDLFNDKFRLQQIITGLKGLRTRTADLKNRFIALSAGLKTVAVGSKSLLDVWDDVSDHLSSVVDNTDMVTPEQAAKIKSEWAKAAADAKKYIDTLQESFITKSHAIGSHRALGAKFNAIPKIPTTPAEIRLYKLAAKHGINPSRIYKRHPHHAHHHHGCGPIHSGARNSNEAVIEAVLSPPDDTQKQLEDLADSTGRVINKFNTLLQQPYLDQYKCTSPIDGSKSDLYTVMNYYRNQYLQLQLDTLPVARDLGGYAALQTALLPSVVPDAEATDADIPMTTFLATNSPLVTEYKESANALSRRSTQVKNDWDNVVNLVHKLIGECDENIIKFNNSIDTLTEQQKKMTLYACLALFGAFLAFTASVFLPGVGMLVALGIGGLLGGLAVYEAISAAKITIAINDLKAAVANEKKTKAGLEELLPYVTDIASSLSSISLIWAGITTALSKLDTFFGVLNGQNGPKVFYTLRPQIIAQWGVVETGVDEYIKAVSS